MTILVCRDVAKSQFDDFDNSQYRGEGVIGSKQNFNYDLLGCSMMIHGVFCLEKDEIIYPII